MCRLKWWFMFCVSLLALIGGSVLGWVQAIWDVDAVKIGPVILLVYFTFSLFVGWLTYHAEKRTMPARYIEQHLKSCYLAVKSMVVLGIIGTTAGLLIMLNMAFGGAMEPTVVLQGLRVGLSTLGVTTLVGLICYLALELQVVNLEYALE